VHYSQALLLAAVVSTAQLLLLAAVESMAQQLLLALLLVEP
jgi:hypothetical protein